MNYGFQKIASNVALCRKCNTTITSTNDNHWKWQTCNCGNVRIKGGTGYICHQAEDRSQYQDQSITPNYTKEQAMYEIYDLVFEKKYSRIYSKTYYEARMHELEKYIQDNFQPNFKVTVK